MKEFRILSESWYAKPNLEIQKQHDRTFSDDIMFGDYDKGGCSWEMRFIEHYFDDKPAIKLSIFDDMFSHLPEIQPILEELSKGNYNTIGKIAMLLVKCGYKNATEREQK